MNAAKRSMGQTGVGVTAIGLGAMPLSLPGHPDEAQAEAVVRTFLDGGGDFIDTANVYCTDTDDVGHNERLIGSILRRLGRMNSTIIGTKGGLTKEGSGWDVRGTPAWLRASCEQSLVDLGVDRIFLYHLHAPDPSVPLADSVGELARLREEGKIAHVGLSNVNVAQIRAAMKIVPIVSVQNKCHVFMKRAFRDGIVDYCAQNRIAFLAHSPVGGHGRQNRVGAARLLVEIAARHQATPWQVALAWLLRGGGHIIPIPGASRPQSIRDSLEALKLELAPDEAARLDASPDW
ncbi:MAG: aldo/keto reductase [Gammaproteobacteria bacterium]|nr:aldo/keto reductase [Gammaproteobacteria bacterium]